MSLEKHKQVSIIQLIINALFYEGTIPSERRQEVFDYLETPDVKYPKEYILLARPNYLHKTGVLKEAVVFTSPNGTKYYMALKSDLYKQ